MYRSKILLCVFCMLGLLISGCGEKEADKKGDDKKVVKQDDSHGHGHVHGPKGGEVFEFTDLGVRGEWVGKYSQDLIIVYIYDWYGKTEKPIKAEKLVGSFKVDETKSFDFVPTNAVDGSASRFECQNEELALAMKSSGITLEVEVDGKKHSVKLAKDPHH